MNTNTGYFDMLESRSSAQYIPQEGESVERLTDAEYAARRAQLIAASKETDTPHHTTHPEEHP